MVNDLPLPEALVSLIQDVQWVHPGEDRLRQVIPFLVDPVVFLQSPEAMARESTGHLADDPRWSATFHMLRGNRRAEPVELPWLDADRSVFIAVCKWPGDDVGIALDYRTGVADPRVVASDWGSGSGCLWREVASTFSSFVKQLGLAGQNG